MKPVLIERKCPAQGQICPVIPACPQGAVLYVEDEAAPLGGRILFDLEICDNCGICVTACCGSAIELK